MSSSIDDSPAVDGDEEVQAFPASFAQERLWFVDQLDPGRATYNIPYQHQARIAGPLDAAALQAAVTALVERHETLRTTFLAIEGTPVQIIRDDVDTTMELIDLQELPDREREAEMVRIVAEHGRHSFDLEAGPLFYTKLIRLSAEDHVFVQMMSHIMVDGMSVEFIIDELQELYVAARDGRPSALPEVPLQYADFVIWHREWMESHAPKKQLDYWKETLSGRLPVMELPTDRPRQAVQQSNGSWVRADFDADLVAGLKELSRAQGGSLFMTMLAGFNVLMHRYSRQDDILIGTPTANRNQPELEKLIAFFVNPVVMRSDLSHDPVFRDFISEVRSTALGAIANQDIPFERLVEELKPERDLSHNPLFQVSFTLQMAPPVLALDGTTAVPVEFDNGTSKFDLLAELWETDDAVSGRFEYDSDLFDQATIERMIENFRVLLRSAVDAPDSRVSQLKIVNADELTLVTEGWNDTQRDYDASATVPGLISAQAARTPASPAVQFGSTVLTYAELEARSNQLARHLVAQGVVPGDLVGLSVDRSAEMMVGVLGVMKSGAAYLPLDPDYPVDRLEFILQDAAAKVLITESAHVDMWSGYDGITVVLDRDAAAIAGHDADAVDVAIDPDSLAYVIHTSGSTGLPKGVKVRHRNVVNFLTSMQSKPGLSDDDVLMAVTTLSFDIAVLELYLPLISGAKVIIAGADIQADGQLMAEALQREGVTVMQATPASWKLLLGAGWDGLATLRILCGGEEITRDLAEALLPCCAELWNMYGPTETTVWSAVKQIESGEGPVPIGEPIANTQLYILDDHLQPVPLGVPGELCIGGDGVTAGYLDRAELTADRFVDDPFVGDSRAKLYRTGDLCRYRPDGSIEFMGRIDLQVKVRGFRIELGEIESVLNQHPSVGEAVVTAQPDPSGGNRLVGYVVAADDAVETAVLREHLAQSLPAYMVPTLFVGMDEWPLTNNGKIDRKALPEPAEALAGGGADKVEPRNELEREMVAIWTSVLGVAAVGMNDNLFELGGHSLLATQLIARVKAAFEVDVSLPALFSQPTPGHLAEQVAAARLLDTGAVDLDADDREEFVL